MFEELLFNLKTEMMPLCSDLAVIAKALAGLGCLIAIAMTTIRAMADNEPINFWSYLRPVSLGFCIIMFDTLVVGGLDGILRPIAKATSSIAEMQEIDYYEKSDRLEDEMSKEKPSSNVVYYLTKDKQKHVAEDKAENLSQSDYEEIARRDLAADKEYKRTWFMSILETLLEVLSYAAKLIINIVGSFFLIILAIMGPLAFAAACFPPLESSFSNWLSHYITVSLWLPLANLLTAVLSRASSMMCEVQLQSISVTGAANQILLLAMMVVGIFGYFSIPSVSNWIVQAGGSGSYARNMTQAGMKAGGKAASGLRSGASAIKTGLGNIAGRYGFGFKK